MYSKIFANTTMDTTTLIAYVVNCSVCFTIGLIFLLTPAQKTSEGKIVISVKDAEYGEKAGYALK